MNSIPILNLEERVHYLEVLDALRERWVCRRPPWPFYTLGAASYLDAAGGNRRAYEEKRRETTPLLRERFGALLDRVAAAIEEVTGLRAEYDEERYAPPGFHIYEAHPDFALPVAKIHCDRQYEGLDWSFYGVNPAERRGLSFTLSLQLPTGGSGLHTWPISHRESGVDRGQARKLFTPEHRKFCQYVEGEMVIHSGDLTHQAVIQLDREAAGRRVTLQGHAVELDDRWLLYW